MNTSATRTATRTATVALAAGASIAAIAVCAAPAQATTVSATRAGTGWVAIETQVTRTHATSIELVSPTGQHTRAIPVGATEALIDVSNDGRRVLTEDWSTTDPTYHVRTIATRTDQHISVGNLGQVRFTNPSGTALLATTASTRTATGNGNAIRLGFDGRVQRTYPGTQGGTLLPSLDGRHLISSNLRHQVTMSDNATGALVRTYANPRGYAFCWPTRNVSASGFDAICSPASGDVSQVFRYSLAGGRPTALTTALPHKQFGYVDHIVTPAGTYVQEGVGCGTGQLDRVRGTVVRPLALNAQGALLGIVGTTAYFDRNGGECDGGGAIVAGSLATGRTVTLVAPRAGTLITGVSIVDPMR